MCVRGVLRYAVLFIQGRGRGDGNTKIIIKTVASDCVVRAPVESYDLKVMSSCMGPSAWYNHDNSNGVNSYGVFAHAMVGCHCLRHKSMPTHSQSRISLYKHIYPVQSQISHLYSRIYSSEQSQISPCTVIDPLYTVIHLHIYSYIDAALSHQFIYIYIYIYSHEPPFTHHLDQYRRHVTRGDFFTALRQSTISEEALLPRLMLQRNTYQPSWHGKNCRKNCYFTHTELSQ